MPVGFVLINAAPAFEHEVGLFTTKEVVLKDIGLFQIPGSNSIDFVYTVSQPPRSFY